MPRQMTQADLKSLERGDLIAHASRVNSGMSYVVTAQWGDRVTAVDTVDVTNPPEWFVVRMDGVMQEPQATIPATFENFLDRHSPSWRHMGYLPTYRFDLDDMRAAYAAGKIKG